MKRIVNVLIMLMAAITTLCFSGCVVITDKYSNADKYSAGECEITGSKVRSLDINWYSGTVTVSRHDKDTVTVTESCGNDLKEEQEVHTWLDGNVLRIQYCKSGESFIFKAIEKDLIVKIPKDMNLDELSYNGSSGDSLIEDISAENINIDVSSGDTKIVRCSADSFDVESSSGEIYITAEKAGEISADSSSGNIEIRADESDSVNAESSSGDITLRFSSMPSETNVDTSSGDVKVYVPEDADFSAEIDTSSGDFDNDIALSKNGSKYVSGNGTNKLTIETSSGDICITK
ncbi:MAG: DUF4097 domain-containing protein [Ruminococcus sp.]|nr:DUF4097 domain-containing protein [Ruminococcus sp.]